MKRVLAEKEASLQDAGRGSGDSLEAARCVRQIDAERSGVLEHAHGLLAVAEDWIRRVGGT